MPPEGIDSLDADNLKALVLSLLTRIDELLARIAELEARAGKPPKTPTNSSLPPSSGQKANAANASTMKKGRKGRPGVARELCANPDVTRDIYAERCGCGGPTRHWRMIWVWRMRTRTSFTRRWTGSSSARRKSRSGWRGAT
jgi:hypothetical protein